MIRRDFFTTYLIKSAGDTKIALAGGSASTIFSSEINLKYHLRHLSKSKGSCLFNRVWR